MSRNNSAQILIVDDSQMDYAMVKYATKSINPNHKIVWLENPELLLSRLTDLIEENAQQNKETKLVVMLDINMPQKTGFECLQEIREHSDSSINDLPVVMSSNSESPVDFDKSYELGANAYVVKPYSGKDYLTMLDSIINFWGST